MYRVSLYEYKGGWVYEVYHNARLVYQSEPISLEEAIKGISEYLIE